MGQSNYFSNTEPLLHRHPRKDLSSTLICAFLKFRMFSCSNSQFPRHAIMIIFKQWDVNRIGILARRRCYLMVFCSYLLFIVGYNHFPCSRKGLIEIQAMVSELIHMTRHCVCAHGRMTMNFKHGIRLCQAKKEYASLGQRHTVAKSQDALAYAYYLGTEGRGS